MLWICGWELGSGERVANGRRAWDHGVAGQVHQVLGGSMACGPVGSSISALGLLPSNDGVGWDLGTDLKPRDWAGSGGEVLGFKALGGFCSSRPHQFCGG